MSGRRCSTPDSESSLFSRLGCESPRPRVKYGGMFSNVEGAFENKTLNLESFGAQRCGTMATRRSSLDREDAGSRRRMFPSRQAGHNHGTEKVLFIFFPSFYTVNLSFPLFFLVY